MKSKIISLTMLAVSVFSLVTFPIFSTFASNPCEDICSEECDKVADAVKEAAGCYGQKDEGAASNLIVDIINWFMGIIGLVAVIAIIISGVQYMTSGGDPGKVKKAKDALLYAVIGLIIVVLAAAIVNFVIAKVTGSESDSGNAAPSSSKPADSRIQTTK